MGKGEYVAEEYLQPKQLLDVVMGEHSGTGPGYSAKKHADEDGKRYGLPPRMRRGLGVLLSQSPDIITVQELDHYNDYLKILRTYGFEGAFYEKNRKSSPAVPYNGSNGPDGVAIFWNTKKFTQEGKPYELQLDKVNLYKDGPNKNKPIPFREGDRKYTQMLYKKGTLSITKGGAKQRVLRVRLKNIDNGEVFSVVTGHMKSGTVKKDTYDQELHVEQL